MVFRTSWRRLWSSWLLVVGLGSAPGCLKYHMVVGPSAPVKEACAAVPPECYKHVYVFLFDGLDPTDCANLSGVRKYLLDLGFCRTYLGAVYDGLNFSAEMKHIHRQDPEARFALIGYNAGAATACAVTKRMEGECIPIDLVVYIDGILLVEGADSRPPHAWQVVNIVSNKMPYIDGAERVQLTDVRPCGAPTHPTTLNTLLHELSAIVERVPPIVPQPVPVLAAAPGAEPLPAPETAPTPRPLPTEELAPPRKVDEETAQRDEWDFLKPSDQLQSLPEQPKPEAAKSAEPTAEPAAPSGDWRGTWPR